MSCSRLTALLSTFLIVSAAGCVFDQKGLGWDTSDAPPEIIFFRDDSDTNRNEILTAVVDGLRISNVARTPAEIIAIQQRLDAQPHVP